MEVALSVSEGRFSVEAVLPESGRGMPAQASPPTTTKNNWGFLCTESFKQQLHHVTKPSEISQLSVFIHPTDMTFLGLGSTKFS